MRRGPAEEGAILHVNLFGITVFSVSLIISSVLLTYAIVNSRTHASTRHPDAKSAAAAVDIDANRETPPWGDLVTSDITLNAPEEYVSFNVSTNPVPAWNFEGMPLEKAAEMMTACGLSKDQVQRAVSLASVTSTNVQIRPDNDLIFSLSPEVRSKFYTKLAQFGSNFYMKWPFCYPRQSFETCMEKSEVSPATLDIVRKLLYKRGDACFFSDYEMMLRLINSDTERVHLAQALMRQPAVLVRVKIAHDTDIDKLLGYWGKGGKVKDVRPLLESIQRLDQGGNVSILYLLPRFARDRLYTFPLPSKTNDPIMDCHWSTMNFFNDVPDNRFSNSDAVATRINSEFYPVGKPSLYGDVIVLLDEHGKGIHSAIYLADDIVFTKNGNNFQMPWKLMRLSDLLAVYGTPNLSSRMQVYRNKSF